MNVLKIMVIMFLFTNYHITPNDSIIILYGCSSVGKTSISQELKKILPGCWKYIAANQFSNSGNHSRNYLLWQEINRNIAQGYNVIVDTHNPECLINTKKDITVLKVMLHCSPEKLIEHIYARNQNADRNTHRSVKTVFKEFSQKYQAVSKKQDSIDCLDKEALLNSYGFLTTLAIKKFLINNFFDSNNTNKVYIAPIFHQYDCLIDTGKTPIYQCAQKIKTALNKK